MYETFGRDVSSEQVQKRRYIIGWKRAGEGILCSGTKMKASPPRAALGTVAQWQWALLLLLFFKQLLSLPGVVGG